MRKKNVVQGVWIVIRFYRAGWYRNNTVRLYYRGAKFNNWLKFFQFS